MPDVLTPKQRSYCMSRIRGKDTKPEFLIRRGLFALGFRYKLHDRALPGCPDIVLPKYRAVIFVHGCLWHGHECDLFKWPETNAAFWRSKIMKNHRKDNNNVEALRKTGWRVMTVWECALRGKSRLEPSKLLNAIARWLSGTTRQREIAGS